MNSTPGSASKKRSRSSGIIPLRDLSALPDPYGGLSDDRSAWPKYIGSDNKNPGEEGAVETYLPYDADVKGMTALDIEANIPFYRNLSAAVVGLIVSVGYDIKSASKFWGANFEEPKGGSSGVRMDQRLWGNPATNYQGAIYVVVDLPLCSPNEAMDLIKKNGFCFLESASLALRSSEAIRRNVFLSKFGARNAAMETTESFVKSTVLGNPPTSSPISFNTINTGSGISGARAGTISALQKRVSELEAEDKIYRKALTQAANSLIEQIKGSENYDTNLILLCVGGDIFGDSNTDTLFRKDDDLGKAIKSLESLDTSEGGDEN